LYGLIFSFFRKKCKNSKILFILLSSLTLIATELLRAAGPMGFTGIRFSDSLYNHTGMLQLNSIIGPYGLLFIIGIVNSVFSLSIEEYVKNSAKHNFKEKKKLQKIFLPMILIVLIFYCSDSLITSTLPPLFPDNQEKIDVVAVQSMTPGKKKHYSTEEVFLDDFKNSMESIYSEYDIKPDLIVFPEAFFMYDIYTYKKTKEALARISDKYDVKVAVPSLAVLNNDFYNAVRFVEPEKGVSEKFYAKIRLNPFTEFLPFEEIFRFLEFLKFARFMKSGNDYLTFNVKNSNIAFPICFEAFYPEVFEQFNANGTDVYMIVTNDGYFDNYTALIQHFSQLNFRAVENRCWFLHVSNNGITGLIDPYGRVVKTIDPFAEKTGLFSIPEDNSIYSVSYSDYRSVFLIFLVCIIIGFYVFLIVIK